MKKSVLMFSLLSGTALMFPRLTIASGFPTHTHTYTPEPKPAFQFEQPDKAYKTASVCFLGFGDCDPNVGFGKGDGVYDVDSSKQCKNEGFVSSCPDGYCLDRSCPYNAAFGKCLVNDCPANSSTTCTGNTVGQNACGENCKKCCDNSCPSGYTSTATSECYDTIRNECGNTCYKAKDCDPCPGYYDCGGTWQYCTGTVCYKDASRCSTYCTSDYFPNKCDNKSDCKGIYRNGYCSGDCTPACVESCYGDAAPKSGEGWTSTPCTTCDGETLYNNTAKPCPSGYSTSVDSCDTAAGYRLTTSGKSGDGVCGKCTNSSCPDGYDTTVKSCKTSDGYVLETNGVSGGQACGKCVPAQCPDGYSTDVISCESGYTLSTSGKSGGQVCGKCDCKLTSRECPTAYEATLSCQKDGLTYYKCELCHREGGSAEGLYYCYNNDGKPSYGFTPVQNVSVVCGGKNYRTSCGCEKARFLHRPYIGTTGIGYVREICGERGYRGNYVNHESWFYRGYIADACDENGRVVGFNKCSAYKCADSGFKVVEAPTSTCGVNETTCCCPENYDGTPNSSICKKVITLDYIP